MSTDLDTGDLLMGSNEYLYKCEDFSGRYYDDIQNVLIGDD